MAEFGDTSLFRMTHIANVPHILNYGLTRRLSKNANPDFVDIGDPNIISSRSELVLRNGKTLGAYIPFYFGTRMPMLYVIQNGFNSVRKFAPEEIVYCVSSVQKIIEIERDFVFTDGHIIDTFSRQYLPEELVQLEKVVDFKAVNAQFWNDKNDLDIKRRKEAEFLV